MLKTALKIKRKNLQRRTNTNVLTFLALSIIFSLNIKVINKYNCYLTKYLFIPYCQAIQSICSISQIFMLICYYVVCCK